MMFYVVYAISLYQQKQRNIYKHINNTIMRTLGKAIYFHICHKGKFKLGRTIYEYIGRTTDSRRGRGNICYIGGKINPICSV